MRKLTPDVLALLDTIAYVHGMPVESRLALAACCVMKTVPKGARAFDEGSPPSGVFLIVSGRMHLVRSSANGRGQVLHEEGPGATLGEVPVFDGGGYVGSAVAAEDAVLLHLPRRALLEQLRRNPDSAAIVIGVLARRVRTFAALVEDLSLRDVTERLAGYLLRESDRTGSASVVLPETRDVIAAQIGTVREQVSRTLARFRREGVIELRGRRVHIVDAARLNALAGERA
jgi:CRP/FNR family transcriptional regulator